jgi:hypothetical protein
VRRLTVLSEYRCCDVRLRLGRRQRGFLIRLRRDRWSYIAAVNLVDIVSLARIASDQMPFGLGATGTWRPSQWPKRHEVPALAASPSSLGAPPANARSSDPPSDSVAYDCIGGLRISSKVRLARRRRVASVRRWRPPVRRLR